MSKNFKKFNAKKCNLNDPYIPNQNLYANQAIPLRKSNIICCEYCKEDNPEEVFMCTEQNCNRWFCNSGRIIGAAGSHIIFHLTFMGHKSIQAHPSSIKEERIECFRCNTRIIFSLGYVIDLNEIICRVPCAKDLDLEVKNWKPLIHLKVLNFDFNNQRDYEDYEDYEDFEDFEDFEDYDDHKFDNHLENFHFSENNKSAKNLSFLSDLRKIEMPYVADNFIHNGNDEDDKFFIEQEGIRIKRVYPDISTYINTFSHLLRHDNIADKQNHWRNQLIDINFNFSGSRDSGFIYGGEHGCRFNYKHKIIITDNKGWDAIAKLENVKEGKFFFTLNNKAPNYVKTVTMMIEFNSSMNDRLSNGLIELGKCQTDPDKIDPDILDILLGKKNQAMLMHSYNEIDYSIPESKKLNDSQNSAIRNALKYKISIIQGPPGTGKTQTVVTLCYNLLLLKKNSIDEIKKRKGLNRIIMENLMSIRESAASATETAKVAVLQCAEAEKIAKTILRNQKTDQKKFKKSILDEIKEINKEIEKNTAELEIIQKNYLNIKSNVSNKNF